jgi:hypothetical protein
MNALSDEGGRPGKEGSLPWFIRGLRDTVVVAGLILVMLLVILPETVTARRATVLVVLFLIYNLSRAYYVAHQMRDA